MIANAAFLAAVTVFLVAAWLAGELVFLAPYKAALFRQHGWRLGGATLVLFFNLCALYYSVARWLFLRDSGRKLLPPRPATGHVRHRPRRPRAAFRCVGSVPMSRDIDPRDIERDRPQPERGARGGGEVGPVEASTTPQEVLTRDLDLPRGPARDRVFRRAWTGDLRGSEVQVLATVGLSASCRSRNCIALTTPPGCIDRMSTTSSAKASWRRCRTWSAVSGPRWSR